MTQYKHEKTCPFLRLMQLTDKLDYDNITKEQLYNAVSAQVFPLPLFALVLSNLATNGSQPETLDEFMGRTQLEHPASLVKTDTMPTIINEPLMNRIIQLDASSKYISPQSLLRYTFLRNVESWVETSGSHTLSVTGTAETWVLIFLLHEGYENGFGIDRSKLETFLRGDEVVELS